MKNKIQNHDLSDSHYTTKKDLWFVGPLLVISLFFLFVPVILFSKPIHPLVKVFGSLFFVTMSLVNPWIIFSISYVLTHEHLVIRCFSKEYSIPLRDIYSVFPTHNPLSAPAFSLDRLRIRFKGSKFGALISPKDKFIFMEDLLSRCPQLVKSNNGLILRNES